MSVLRAEGVGTCTVAGPEMWASVHVRKLTNRELAALTTTFGDLP